MIQCNDCGYPVINGMHTCPNCLAEMPDEIVATVPVEEEEVILMFASMTMNVFVKI